MKNRISALLLALVMTLELLAVFPFQIFAVGTAAETEQTEKTQESSVDEGYIEGMVTLTCNGKSSVSLGRGEKLYAFTELDPTLGDGARYSWQIKTGSGKWATVSGYVYRFAVVSEALLMNAINGSGRAELRCIVTVGSEKYVSDVLTVTADTADAATTALSPMITEERATPLFADSLAADGSEGAESIGESDNGSSTHGAFQIVINYSYRHLSAAPGLNLDGANAANTFTVTLPENAYYTGTVSTPLEIGYLPYVKVEQKDFVTGTPQESDRITYGGEEYVLANSIQFNNQTEGVTVNVYYIPQEVTFRVKIYEQNLYDDEYTLAETVTKTGIANSAVGEGHDTARRGFSPLYYDPDISIAEDGSFAIDIYYDRIYYLVDFDLNDNDEGAFGAPNHLVRYKTPVVLPPPTRPGYIFAGWTLTSVKADLKKDEETDDHSYPEEADGGYMIHSVEHNLAYKAGWEIGKTSYTVIYWLENAENDSFTLDSFKVVSDVTPGAVVSAVDDLAISDADCFEFEENLSDKNVTVSADGTTAVNAYYLRRYYTLSFSGNSACIIKEHTHSDACPQGNCTLENHTHTEACGTAELICGLEEHVHANVSYDPSKPEECGCNIEVHEHTSACCTIPYHVHGTGANSDCTKPEHPLHHATCYSRNELKEADTLTNNNQKNAYTTLKGKIAGPLNGYVYRIRTGSWYSSTIYNFIYVHNKWFYLGTGTNYNGVTVSISNPSNTTGSYSSAQATAICGYELHTHGDGNCTCTITEHDHTSGCTCTIPRHVHGEGNCNYVCDKTAHRHNISCYSHNCGKIAHTHGGNCVRSCQQIEHTHTSDCSAQKNRTFLSFTAKYNADISGIWKSIWEKFPNGERWKANTHFSEVLVYLPFMPPTDITFTENDGTANTVYEIKYYLESLGTTDIPYQGKYFDLNNTVNARYSYLTKAEDFFDIPGFTQLASNPGFSNNRLDSSTDVSLYYSRNSYDLEFVSLGTTLTPFTGTLKYQQPIGASFEVMPEEVPYPSNKETGAIRFVGWYSSPNCAEGTEFYFDGNSTMPIGGLVLYAKWEDCSYTVNVYSNVEKEELLYTDTVLFDSYIEEPDYTHIQHPEGLPEGEHPGYNDKDHLIFAGWYYKVGGEEKRFDFNTMPVKDDMEIYAKWTSRIPVNYTVRYVYWNGSEYVDIADKTTGASLAGVTKSFVAKVDTELYEDYEKNFFPDIRSHSMTMSSDASENVFLFVYSSLDEVKYTVSHLFTDTAEDGETGLTVFESIFGSGNDTLEITFTHTISGEQIKEHAATVAVSFREGVTKENVVAAAQKQYGITLTDRQATSLWESVTNMSPNFFIQNLILTSNSEENEAVFSWGDLNNQALYQIIYYTESVDGSEFVIHSTKSGIVEDGTEVSAEEIGIEYFEYDPSLGKSSGIATKTTVDSTGALSQGLVLKMYYMRREYKYTVHYYKTGSTVDLIPAVEGKAKYQHTIAISDVAENIEGYTLINGDELYEITANDAQTIECYYQGLEVNYQYQIIGSGANFDDPTDIVRIGGNAPVPKTVKFWNDGYFLYKWYYSVEDGERQEIPSGWTISNGNTTIQPPVPDTELAGKTVYVYAEVLPTTRRFIVQGFATEENDPQAFVFRLQGKAGTETAGIDVTFIIFDTGHTDISHLPYGEYTLTTLHWAWRLGHPTSVSFNGEELDAASGSVYLYLNVAGDVIITYPATESEQWLSDDASGVVPIIDPVATE